MKFWMLTFLVALGSLMVTGSVSMAGGSAPTVVMPSSISWTPIKGIKGAWIATLYGDPTKAGSEYVRRYKLNDGVKFPPHTHPMVEEVTVLSGTFLVAIGSKWSDSALKPLPAGSFVAIPANLAHYGESKGDTILQVNGVGPDKMIMVPNGM